MNHRGVSIVVLNWNGWRDTIECLESLCRLDYPNYRIVVVDNGSTDGSVEHICDWAEGSEVLGLDSVPPGLRCHVTPPVSKPVRWTAVRGDTVVWSHDEPCTEGRNEQTLTILETGVNLGYAGGNNVGVRFALAQGAQYIWILNNDTVVDSHALSALIERVVQDQRVGLCGGTIVQYYDPVRVQVAGGAHFDDIRGRQEHIGTGRRLDDLPEPAAVEVSLSYVSGSAVLVTRGFLDEVGLMDERHFLYYEELDWAIRGNAKGYSLGYAPDAIVYHKEGGSSGSSARNPIPSPLAEYYLTRSLLLVTRKYYPKSTTRVWCQLVLRLAKRTLLGKWSNARALALAVLRPEMGSSLETVQSALRPERRGGSRAAGDTMDARILYVMHVDWDSIWQRPHEFARQLRRSFDLLVLYPVGRKRSSTVHNTRQGFELRLFLQLYRRREHILVAALNRARVRWLFRRVISRYRPDAIWVTHPELVEYLPSDTRARIVYDCMDDAMSFPQPAVFTDRMRLDEAALVARSDLVLVSSVSLCETLQSRYGTSTHAVLVRNGCAAYQASTTFATSRGADGLWHLGYVGVSSTLDFQALAILMSSRSDLFLDMYGPVDWDVESEQLSGRICWHGPIAHEDISTRLDSCCCLVAPYRLNDRVLAADSVKLYDYVSIGKPIVARRYPEIGRFSDFAEFYETPQELVGVVSRMCSEGFVRKYTEEQRMAFLSENTWDVRGQQIRRELQDVLSRGKG